MRDPPQHIRIAIADSVPLFLDGLEQLLRCDPQLLLTGRFSSGRDAVDGIEHLRPDVALIDLHLRSGNGTWVLGQLRQRRVPTLIILVAAEIGEHELTSAIRLGAKGVLLKEMQSELILRCIHKVHAGEEWLEMKSVGSAFRRMIRERTPSCAVCALSKRASEIAALAAAGYRNREIGERLFITEGTVKGHLNRIYEKLGVRHRIGLVRAVRECGMLDLDGVP